MSHRVSISIEKPDREKHRAKFSKQVSKGLIDAFSLNESRHQSFSYESEMEASMTEKNYEEVPKPEGRFRTVSFDPEHLHTADDDDDGDEAHETVSALPTPIGGLKHQSKNKVQYDDKPQVFRYTSGESNEEFHELDGSSFLQVSQSIPRANAGTGSPVDAATGFAFSSASSTLFTLGSEFYSWYLPLFLSPFVWCLLCLSLTRCLACLMVVGLISSSRLLLRFVLLHAGTLTRLTMMYISMVTSMA